MDTTRPRESLWVPIVAPVTWSAHFTVCYIWVAMACGRFGNVDRARAGVAIVTAVAAVAIAACFAYGLYRHGVRLPDRPNDDGTPEDRTRFMALTTMLLAALSLVGTLYVGIAAMAVGGCR